MKTSLVHLLSSLATTSGFGFGLTGSHYFCNQAAYCQHHAPLLGCRAHIAGSSSDEDGSTLDIHDNLSRRSLLHSTGLQIAGVVTSGPLSALLRFVNGGSIVNQRHGISAANAMGLVHFPCKPGDLFNTYHLMRAGQSGLEAQDILSSNPLFLTNREDALTDLGVMQVEEACNDMMSKGINPSVVKYSLASKCIDTANIVATKMMVGRNRIVPEFTFMDPRGAGSWDGKSLASTEAAIWAMDAAEAGEEGRYGKPPPNDDGTANETLFEQVIRLRQLMSILETQYSGDNILLVFPDGTSPALLSCLIAGIPLKNVHALNFAPGELRAGVDMNNSRQLLKEKLASPTYNEILSVGKEELDKLRNEERLRILEKEKPSELLVPNSKPKDVGDTTQKEKRSSRFADNYDATKVDLGPDIFSVGAIASMGSMAMWRGGDKDDEESVEEVKSASPVLAYANSTGSSVFEPPMTISASSSTPVNTVPRNIVLDADAGLFNPNVFEDVPVLSKQEREEAAQKAMDEYLNRDDGGDDWICSMQDIMNEE